MNRNFAKVFIVLLGLVVLAALPHGAMSQTRIIYSGTAKLSGLDEFPILSMSEQVSIRGFSGGGGGGGGSSSPDFQDVTLTKSLDMYSPLLFIKTAQGSVFPEVTLTFTYYGDDSLPKTFLIIRLQNVVIESISNGVTSSVPPTENLSLRFDTIRWTTPEGGTVGWNVKTNRPL